MKNETEIKALVREKYSGIASQPKQKNYSSCCGAAAGGQEVYSIMADEYAGIEGYNPDADLGLGCGLPTEFARIKEGDTVIDLGSGAGNDAFIARRLVGEKGKVIGIDFTEKMIERARANAKKLQYNNVEFRQGDIENMPVFSNTADVIVSNCVLNLVPDKHKVFSEIFRVLKPGGHFSISDIVLQGELPEKWKQVAELYAGCVAGAIRKQEYLDIIAAAGFTDIILQKEKPIVLPDDILKSYLTEDEINEYKKGGVRIESITVYAKKSENAAPVKSPGRDERNCCEPGSGCC